MTKRIWINSDLKSPAHQLRLLQRALYEKAHKEAKSIVAGSSKSILVYSDRFESTLPNQFEKTTLPTLLDDFHSHDLILYGDFHTLRQTQRGLLRLLRSYTERLRDDKLIMALEMFKAKDQAYIDRYMSGDIDDLDFLKLIRYSEGWGFPWQNFKMLLDFAKEKSLSVIGINSDLAGKETLFHRDRFAAKTLARTLANCPNHKVVCLIGEFHLADNHLPKALRKEFKSRKVDVRYMRILANIDRYYFAVKRSGRTSPTEYLKLEDGLYCIMNSPPWMKWQSFAMWEEMRRVGIPDSFEEGSDIDDFGYTEDGLDVDYHLFSFTKSIADFLNIPTSENQLQSFNVVYSPDASFFETLVENERLSMEISERIVERATADGIYFLPQSCSIYITKVSINNLAEAAGQFFHNLKTNMLDDRVDPTATFLAKIIKAAAGMVGSRVLNPRRKAMNVSHHRNFLLRMRKRRLAGHAKTKRDAARLLIKFDHWIQARLKKDASLARPPITLFLEDRRSNYEVSREIGLMLGSNLYTRIIAGEVPISDLHKLFNGPLDTIEQLWGQVVRLYRCLK